LRPIDRTGTNQQEFGVEESFKQLLTELEQIGKRYGELYDTSVRHAMNRAVMDGFARMTSEFVFPTDYCMRSEAANKLVSEAFDRFLTHSRQNAMAAGLVTFHQRLDLLQNDAIRTPEGKRPDDFFGGYIDPAEYDQDGHYLSG
jgi:hypothetical protein